MRKLLFLLMALALAASAADVSGTWKGSMETPGGAMESTIVLKADGAKLTGSMQGGPGGDMKIDEGKVDGDKVSFSVSMEFGKLVYAGTFTADEMKLKMSFGGGEGGPGGDMPPMELICKRVK
jgi:hypothetical protein